MHRIARRSHCGSIAVLALALGGAGLAAPARALEPDAGAPGDWLSRYVGARSVGYGGAFVAAASEAMGILWNPAGLSALDQNEAHFEMSRLFEDTSLQGFSFVAPARRIPSLGITLVQLSSGGFERTDELNAPLGTFDEGEMAVLLTASKSVSPRLALGGNLKIVRQSLEDFESAGVGMDLGVLVDATPKLRLGASILNVGGPSLTLRDTEEKYPAELRGGFAVRVFGGRGTIAGELDQRSGPGISLHGGSEFWVIPNMALRLGYNEAYATGGFSYRVTPSMQFDYGVSDHDLGLTHRAGLTYRFGGFFASSEAVPPVFSPTGQQAVTKFEIEAHTKADAREWRLDIVNNSNQTVRQFGGKGAPPQHVMWDGKDETGLPLADGVYRYQIVVWDNEGREILSHARTVEITTSGPQGSVPVLIQP